MGQQDNLENRMILGAADDYEDQHGLNEDAPTWGALREKLEGSLWFIDHGADALTQHDDDDLWNPLHRLMIDCIDLEDAIDASEGQMRDRNRAMLQHRKNLLGELLYPLMRDYLKGAAE